MDKAGIMELRESDPTEFGYTANKHLFSDYGIAVGDTVIFTFEIKVHTVSGDGDINGIDGIATIYDSSNSAVDTLTVNKNAGSTTENYITSDFEDTILILSSLPYVIPATASYWFVYTEVHISNSSGVTGLTSYTKELGRIGIRKIA